MLVKHRKPVFFFSLFVWIILLFYLSGSPITIGILCFINKGNLLKNVIFMFSYFHSFLAVGIALQTEIAVPTGFRCFKADAITVSSTEPWRHGWFECCSERHSVS